MVDEVLLELFDSFLVEASLLVLDLLVKCFPDESKTILQLGFLQNRYLGLAQFLTI